MTDSRQDPGPAPPRRRRARIVALAAAAVMAGCRGDGSPEGRQAADGRRPPAGEVGEPAAAAPADGPPECVRRGYPCTWDEVPPETVTRSHLVGEIASLLMQGGSTAGEVASFLARDTAVAEVMIAGSRVRFRLRGGRPGWIYPPDEMDHHLPPAVDGQALPGAGPRPGLPPAARGPAPVPGAGPADGRGGGWLSPPPLLASAPAPVPQAASRLEQGIAAPEPGEPKKALVVSPFAYQWMGNVSAAAVRMLRGVRDYRRAEGGQVTYHADLEMLEDNPPTTGTASPSGEVVLDDFLHWDDYSLVLVVTHGYPTTCDAVTMPATPEPGRRRPGSRGPWTLYDDEWEERIANDPDIDPGKGCPKVWAGRAKQADYGAYPGVEIGWFSRAVHPGPDPPPEPDTRYGTPQQGWDYTLAEHPGLTTEEAKWCRAEIDRGVPDPTTAGGRKPCTYPRWEHRRPVVGLTLPFFRDRYPDGLRDTIVFVAACWSGLNYYLLDHLAGMGTGQGSPNENVAAFGFFGVGVNGRDYQTAIPTMLEQLHLGFHAWKMLNEMRDVSPQVVGRAFGSGGGGTAAHGRDVTELWDVGAGHELEEGGTVPLLGVAGDGKEDSLDVRPTFVGVSDPAALEEVRLRVRVDGAPTSDEDYEPAFPAGRQGAYEHRGVVPLGRDARRDEVVDLEIEADLPGGRTSRWVYEEMRLGSCSVPIDGAFDGDVGGALARRVRPGRPTTARISRRRGPADPTGTGRAVGEWRLSLASSVKWGDDLDLGVYFPGLPEPGRSVTVSDQGLLDVAVSGGVHEPDDVDWNSGTVRIRFTAVDERPGSGDLGVCGEITADLVGLKDPPAGGVRPVEVPATFTGAFRAVWRRD